MTKDEPRKNKKKGARRNPARVEPKREPIEVVVSFSLPDPGEKPGEAANSAGKADSPDKSGSPKPIVFRF